MTATERQAIIDRERAALDRWSAGDPVGYVAHTDADVTYFDDIGARERIRGQEALRRYAAGLQGRIPPHEYRMVDPVVQQVGDAAILTFRYEASKEGEAMAPWRATTVYARADGDWRLVHAHWSINDKA